MGRGARTGWRGSSAGRKETALILKGSRDPSNKGSSSPVCRVAIGYESFRMRARAVRNRRQLPAKRDHRCHPLSQAGKWQ